MLIGAMGAWQFPGKVLAQKILQGGDFPALFKLLLLKASSLPIKQGELLLECGEVCRQFVYLAAEHTVVLAEFVHCLFVVRFVLVCLH